MHVARRIKDARGHPGGETQALARSIGHDFEHAVNRAHAVITFANADELDVTFLNRNLYSPLLDSSATRAPLLNVDDRT